MYSEKRRITPKMVVDAYVKTGLVPIKGHFFMDLDGPCGCAIGALIMSQDESFLADAVAQGSATRKFFARITKGAEENYRIAFTHGFDRSKYRGRSEIGYRDGRAAAKAVGL